MSKSGLICTGKKIRNVGKSEIYHDGYFNMLFSESLGGMSMTRNDCLVFINNVLHEDLPPLTVGDMDNDFLCERIFYFVMGVCEESIGPPSNEKGDFDIENTDWNFWRTVWNWRCFRNEEMDHCHVDDLILCNVANFGRDGLKGGKSLESYKVTNAVWNGEKVDSYHIIDSAKRDKDSSKRSQDALQKLRNAFSEDK